METWSKKKFTDCCELIHGFQFREEHFAEKGIPIVKIGNLIDGGGIDITKASFVPNNKLKKFEKYVLKKGDILMALTGGTLGKVSRVNNENGVILQNYRVGKFVPKENSIRDYIYYVLQSHLVQQRVKNLVNEAAQPNFGKQDFDKIKVPIPTRNVQIKIAEILSTWDQAIDNTQQLIEQLELRKKGLMQELLTAEKRLPGFDGEWKEVRLGDYLKRHSEVSEYSNQYPVLTSSREGMFFQSDYYTRDVASKDNTGYNVVPKGYFTYRHMSDDLIFKFNINSLCDKGIVSTLYPVFTTEEGIKDDYLELVLNHGEEFKRYALKQKQGGSRTYMYFKKLEDLKIQLPNLKEQDAMIDFVDTVKKEISDYNHYLDILKRQKNGLMQQLLTGKKRVSC